VGKKEGKETSIMQQVHRVPSDYGLPFSARNIKGRMKEAGWHGKKAGVGRDRG